MRKTFTRLAITLPLALSLMLLCACAPRFVGEEQAKKSGLTLLRQAFGINAQDAHVEYFERAGSSVVDNQEVQSSGKAPTKIYIVTISDQTLKEDLYYAEVDAKTGVAYYASKNEWLLTPAPAQQNSTQKQNNMTSDTDSSSLQEGGAEAAACDWVKRCFQKEVALISTQGYCHGDSTFCPRARIGYFVTFADGSLYRVGFSWPAMDLNEVQVLGNERKGVNP